ncbi:hypothetical protein [Hydrogenimonas sp.]
MKFSVPLLIVALLLGGCGLTREVPLPQQTAQSFWDAMVRGDRQEAKALTIRGRLGEPLLKVRLERVTVAGARVVGGRAFVPTTLFFAIPVDGAQGVECNATMETELLEVRGRWLIDDAVTMEAYDKALQKGTATCTSKIVEKAFEQGLERFESVKKELERGFFDFAREFQESFRSLQKELNETLRRLQKEPGMEPSELPKPQEGERI